MHSNILTTKERHALVVELKTSRNDFLKSVEGLSAKQINFKPSRNALSIKACVYRIVSIEDNLWTLTQAALKQDNASSQRTNSDESLVSLAAKDFSCHNIEFKNVEQALKFYKNKRTEMLKYVHTSTEDVRGHIAQTDHGNLDAYQLILLNALYCKNYMEKIQEIKEHPKFPK